MLAGQRVDPAEQMEPAGALAARGNDRALATLGPHPSELGMATIAAFILKEHHPLVAKPQRLAEFFFTVRWNWATPFILAWRY